MKNLFIFIVFFFICFLNTLSHSGEILKETNYDGTYLTLPKYTQISSNYFNQLGQSQALSFQDSLTKEQRLAQLPGYKLPKRALFFSAVVPGAGQFYTKSYIKAAAFFLVEVGAWTYYASYNNKGKDKEREYQGFANESWFPKKWYNWYVNIDSTYQKQMTHASHMVELIDPFIQGTGDVNRTQQYYEMIGKYAEFVVGWQGTDNDVPYNQLISYRKNNVPIADDYMKMRDDSNKLFDQAKTGVYIAMVNHVLSAIDAAWTAKRHNNRLLEASVRVEQIYWVNHYQPVLSLRIKW